MPFMEGTHKNKGVSTMDEGITIYIEGGVIQDITGIPEGGKVTVVDWDTDGVDPEDLTQLEDGQAVVTIWHSDNLEQEEDDNND